MGKIGKITEIGKIDKIVEIGKIDKIIPVLDMKARQRQRTRYKPRTTNPD